MNTRPKAMLLLSAIMILSMILAACQTATPVIQTVVVTQETEKEVEVEKIVTEIVEVEKTVEVFVTPTPAPTTRTGGWLDEVTFSVVGSDSALTQIQAGAIDLYADGLAPSNLPAIEEAGLNHSTQGGTYYELTFNPAGPVITATETLNPFGSPKVREAMNWLVDRTYLKQEVYSGGGLERFFPITTQMPEYTDLVDVARALEAKYAYNPEMANEVITAEMEAMGATKEGDKWTYNGEPVTLIFLIRNDSDGTRVPIGDYVANQLESIGFTVDRQYKTSSEAAPLWQGSAPAEGLWHLYTAAWTATAINRNEADNFQFFYTPASDYAFLPLWQAYTPTEEFTQLADDLANNRFNSLEERRTAYARALELSMEDSSHVWLIDGQTYSPFDKDVNVAWDLAAGIDGSQIGLLTLRFANQEGGRLNWGQPDLFVNPWNPVAGSNWAFDQSAINGTQTGGVFFDPYTGIPLPFRLESAVVTVQEGLPVAKTHDWVTLEFAPTIEVPEDAWADWDAENGVFINASEKYTETQTAQVKSVVTYPADLFETIKWHDGSALSPADFVMNLIMWFDPAKEESAIFDESRVPGHEADMSTFKGARITSTDPLTIEWYTDGFDLDAELNVVTLWPEASVTYLYGNAPWHMIAVNNAAEAAGELAYSEDKADAEQVEWANWIGGPSLEVLRKHLDQLATDGTIPYANVLGEYITAEEAAARYANLQAWNDARGHFWVGTGQYFLDKVFLTEKVLTLSRFADYPDLANRWSTFGAPRFAQVELDGPGQVTIGDEAVYDVFVNLENGDVYPQADVKAVKALLFDATGALVHQAEATAVTDGQYQVTLPAEVTSALAAGANRLEVAVVPFVVASPTFASLEFVTAP